MFNLKNWFKSRFSRKSKWIPFHLNDSCLCEVGEYIEIEKCTDTVDMVALSMGTTHIDKAGEYLYWKVLEVKECDLKLRSKGTDLIISLLNWTEAYDVVQPSSLLRSEVTYRLYRLP